MRWAWTFGAMLLLSANQALAYDERAETLADIRQSLIALSVEIRKLQGELDPHSAADIIWLDDNMLNRVDSIEKALTYLTAKTERLEFRITQIVADGTNQIGNLEFRLVELEGGDVSTLGEISTLGGDVIMETENVELRKVPSSQQLALGEKADFSRASKAYEAEEFAIAAELFEEFVQTYPGGPFNSQAFVLRGKSLDALGETKAAARSYLESYTRHPQSEVAPEALLRLGLALDGLQQTKAACKTLGEVALRFPQSDQVPEAQSRLQGLNCS